MEHIDLQCHTVASDGELEAKELVDLALKQGLKAIAITDHDSIGSVQKAIEYAKDRGIEIVPGVELSCDDPLFDFDKIDVLGLLTDINNKKLADLIKHINSQRDENKKQIIEKLKGMGYKIEFNDVKMAVKGTFGRPHIAKYLLKKYPEKFSSVADVFDRLIGVGKPAFLETHDRVSIEDGIKAIHGAGGVAILAHPGIYPQKESLKLIDYFLDNGGDGIETYYPYHIICPELKIDERGNEEMIKFYKSIAAKKHVLESGGNDHHGNFRFTLGKIKIPYSVLENIRSRKAL
ncbi:PHP domain-containing protein [Candidatus Woesearchaeota archaeon]|nr:PHP domain-containing protein [Candidatus Woesearchaeota archaeon]